MTIPWSSAQNEDFDPTHPRARNIESSPQERAQQFQSNICSKILAPIIAQGEGMVNKLLQVCGKQIEVLLEVGDKEELPEEYEDPVDLILVLCRALPAVQPQTCATTIRTSCLC